MGQRGRLTGVGVSDVAEVNDILWKAPAETIVS